jgi:hypothetical protein
VVVDWAEATANSERAETKAETSMVGSECDID